MKILLVDDEKGFLDQAKIFLEKINDEFVIDTVESALKGLEKIEKEEYDGIVSDYQMPKMDGLEFLEEIRKVKEMNIPFIMFTGKGREDVAMDALNLGADRYIQKGGNQKSQYGLLAQAIDQEVKHWKSEKELKQIGWLIKKEGEESVYSPPYGDLSELNDDGVIKNSVSKEALIDITDHFLNLLDTSCAIYEKNGDYALGIFSSGWCQYLDSKSRELCDTEDNQEALECGDWLCHESCWESAIKCMKEKKPVDVKCEGGLHLYAVPITVEEDVVGVMNFGYGNLPDDDEELKKIAEKYDADFEKLKKLSQEYDRRPEFIIEAAKNRIETSARLLGEIIKSQKMEEELKETNRSLSTLIKNLPGMAYRCKNDKDWSMMFLSEACADLTGYSSTRLISDKKINYNDLIHPDDREYVWKEVQNSVEKDESFEVEYRIITADDEQKWVWEQGRATRYADDGTEILEGIIVDITDRKKAYQQVDHLNSLLKAIRNVNQIIVQGYSIQNIMEKACKSLVETRSYIEATVALLDEKTGEISPVAEEGEHIFAREWSITPDGEGDAPECVKKSVSKGDICIINTDECGDCDFKDEYETHTTGIVTMELDGNLVGLLHIAFKEITDVGEDEIGLLKEVADDIAFARNKKISDRRLKREKELFEAIFNRLPLMVTVYDPKMDEFRVNDKFVEILGWTNQDVQEMDVMKVCYPDPEYREKVQEFMSKADPEWKTFEVTSKDGRTVKSSWTNIKLSDDRQIGIGMDLREKKKLEKELRKSEERYRRLFETAQDGMLILDAKSGEIIDANPFIRDMLKYSLDELKGKRLWDIGTFKDIVENKEKFTKLREEEYVRYEHLPLTTKNGEEKYVEFVSNLYNVGEKEVIQCNIRDISERKEAELKKEETEMKLKELHKMASTLENKNSEEEICQTAIDAAENILEFSICSIDLLDEDGNLVVKAVSEEVSTDEYFEEPPDKSSLGGKTFLNNKSYLVDDLQEYEDASPVKEDYRSAISVPIKNKGVFQAISGETGYFDESDLEMAELLMSHVSEALDRVYAKEREEFLHSLLRHDVMNKSQIAKGYFGLMRDFDLPEEVYEYLNKAERATEEGIEIIEKVRKLRKIEKEESIEKVNISSVLDQIVSQYHGKLNEMDIDIEIEESDISVKGGSLLRELFSNLVENSIKHSGCNIIKINCKEREDEVMITIEDDGVGIPNEKKDEIFKKGYKIGDDSGSGLGLYMVKEIAESYGGSIEVKDSDMGGVRFDVCMKKSDE